MLRVALHSVCGRFGVVVRLHGNGLVFEDAERATAFLIVTHNPALACRCDRVIELVDGAIVYDGPPTGMTKWDTP